MHWQQLEPKRFHAKALLGVAYKDHVIAWVHFVKDRELSKPAQAFACFVLKSGSSSPQATAAGA